MKRNKQVSSILAIIVSAALLLSMSNFVYARIVIDGPYCGDRDCAPFNGENACSCPDDCSGECNPPPSNGGTIRVKMNNNDNSGSGDLWEFYLTGGGSCQISVTEEDFGWDDDCTVGGRSDAILNSNWGGALSDVQVGGCGSCGDSPGDCPQDVLWRRWGPMGSNSCGPCQLSTGNNYYQPKGDLVCTSGSWYLCDQSYHNGQDKLFTIGGRAYVCTTANKWTTPPVCCVQEVECQVSCCNGLSLSNGHCCPPDYPLWDDATGQCVNTECSTQGYPPSPYAPGNGCCSGLNVCANGLCQSSCCGDGTVNYGEQCEIGSYQTQACGSGGTQSRYCTSSCTWPSTWGTCTGSQQPCGNGQIDTGEQCDGSNLNGKTCVSQGYGCGALSCTSSCTFNTGSCSNSCSNCGNGQINSGEQCDGSNLNGKTCVSQGYGCGALSCTSSCTFNTGSCSNSCGACGGNPPPGYGNSCNSCGGTIQCSGSCSPPCAGCQGNCAQFISQNVPTTMISGQPYPVWVRMKNTGTTTWTAGSQYKLGSQNPQDNGIWGFGRVNIPSAFSPGQEKEISFTVTAPSPGTRNFQWRMLREGVEWFGDSTLNVPVSVTNVPPSCPDGSCNSGETCSSCPADCGTCQVCTPNTWNNVGSCGNCGTNQRYCDSNGQWTSQYQCINQGSCSPGQAQCSGSSSQFCNSGCQWQAGGTDNDGDGVDLQCGDSQCDNAYGVYDSTKTPTETSCADTHDNDCDGRTDCLDSDCAGQTGPGGVRCCQSASDCVQDDCVAESCAANNCQYTNRNTCDAAECPANQYCNAPGGDCKSPDADSTVCINCIADQTSGLPWTWAPANHQDSGKQYGSNLFNSNGAACPPSSCSKAGNDCHCFDTNNIPANHKTAMNSGNCCGNTADEFYKPDAYGPECTNNVNDCVWNSGDAQAPDTGNAQWWCYAHEWAQCLDSTIGTKPGSVCCAGVVGNNAWTPNSLLKTENQYSCTDGLDNDCDGLTDCNDPDCNGVLKGTVKNTDGQPILKVDVIAKRSLTNFKSAFTNQDGTYNMPINCGTYNIVASHPEYGPGVKGDIVIPPNQEVTADFDLVLGSSCESDCTFVSDNLVYASCDGKNGCGFYDATAKAACDLSQPGWIREYDSSNYVVCPSGSPQPKVEIQASLSCASGTITKATRIVIYNGKPAKLVVAACR